MQNDLIIALISRKLIMIYDPKAIFSLFIAKDNIFYENAGNFLSAHSLFVFGDLPCLFSTLVFYPSLEMTLD